MSTICYQLLQPSQHEEALSFFYEWFLKHEPLTKSLQRPGWAGWKKEGIIKMMCTDVSWVAVEQESRRIVGLFVCEAMKKYPDRVPGEQFMPEKIDVLMNKLEINVQDAHVDLFGAGVCEEYQERGICTELARRAVDHAAKLGYHTATIICTSKYTQMLSIKLGFQVIKEIKYAEYVVDGDVVFPNVEEPHRSVIYYRKML